MNIDDIIRDAADTIRQIPALSSVEVFEEDKGDIAQELERAIAQQAFSVTVGWNGFTPQIGGPTAPHATPFGTVKIVVAVFEMPAVNRAGDGTPRLLGAAKEIAKALDGAASEGMDETLHLRAISPIQQLDRGVITCDVEFETKATL